MVSPIDSTLRALARHHMILEVRCRNCERVSLFDPGWLAQRRNPLTDYRRLRFKCDQCGLRDSSVLAIPDDWQA